MNYDLIETGKRIAEVRKQNGLTQEQFCEIVNVSLTHFANVENARKGASIELLVDNAFTYIKPDFYSEEKRIVGEIFARIGKYKKVQSNKLSNDILKMILLEKVTGKEYRKIIAICDLEEKKRLEGNSILAESIRQFDIELLYVEVDEELRKQIIEAQEIQKMTNV